MPILGKDRNFPRIFTLPGLLFCCSAAYAARRSIPHVGHLDLFVELFLRGVEFLVARRAADRRFGFDIFAASHAHRQYAVARLHVVLELRSAVPAPDFVSCSHNRFLLGSRYKGTAL